MKDILLVGIGSFLGGIGRYSLSGLCAQLLPSSSLPWGTLAVNVIGSFAIGYLGGIVESQSSHSPLIRPFLVIGFLGGFTTFSAFSMETFALFRTHGAELAITNIAASVISCLLAVAIGFKLASAS